MKDFLGRELAVGDEVVWLDHQHTSSMFYRGKVTRFTPQKVGIETFSEDGTHVWSNLKLPYHVVKVEWSDVKN